MRRSRLAWGALAGATAAATAVAVSPGRYRVERSIHVDADSRSVLAEIAEPRRWLAWWPEEAGDPGARRDYGGPASGPGSSYHWSSATRRGRLTVLEVASGRVELERETLAPYAGLADVEVRLSRDGDGLRVSWAQSGELSLPDRVSRLLGRGDEPLTASLDLALARLRVVAEAGLDAGARRETHAVRVRALPADLLPWLVDLRRWERWWSPAALPPDVVLVHARTPGDGATGPGTTLHWTGGGSAGRVTILDAGPDHVEVELVSDLPRPAVEEVLFRISTGEGASRVEATRTVHPGGGAAGPSPVEGGPGSALDRALERLAAAAAGDP